MIAPAICLISLVASAVLTMCGFRYTAGLAQKLVFFLAAVTFLVSTFFCSSLGGFWPGLFTVITGYMLVCSVLPWADLLRREYVS
jgi:uncharacterized membrane protein YtjA (UPF0391 family)